VRRPSRRRNGAPLRAADPHKLILVGAISYVLDSLLGDSFLEGLIAQHVLPPADALTVQFYRAGPPESLGGDVGHVRDLLGAAGGHPVWSGSGGGAPTIGPRRRRV
jgi:hypothetical protein